ncbi:MAG: efflux RND transporter periplasmic adaptor subunit [Candidatus Eremiobacteraeota bacterium]|nr:efflux RND transporter periplasmic adaptor subunit [Candidatus Eremiobacteraeota bacterium]MCW5868019.1 efflux RND transporter periplasmic adaptor subunit [Candidatus Eremiobacteraeota bacterium]
MALAFMGCTSGRTGLPEVKTSRLQKADMSIRYVASGHVVSKTIRIGAPDTGTIVALPVQLNEPVKKGQVLFQIDDAEARQTLQTIESDIASARAKAEENRALIGIRRSQSATQVAQAQRDQEIAALEERQKLIGASRDERQKLRETVRQAQEKLRLSEVELRRQKQLFKEEIASQSELDKAESDYRQNQSSYREAQADYRAQTVTRSEEIAIQRTKALRAAEATLLAQQKGSEEDLIQFRVRSAEAEVDRLQASAARQRYLIERRRVICPSNGIVSMLNFEQGETVTASATVLAIVTHGPYYVEAEVDEQDAVHVAVNQPVNITLTSLPGKSFPGKVVEVAPSLEARPQGPSDHKVLRIKVNFAEKVPELRSGLEADVQGQVGLAKETLSLPRSSLLRDAGKDYVYTVKDGKLSRIEVTLGTVSGDRAEIKSGLTPSTDVVVEGGDGLAAGTAVKVVP